MNELMRDATALIPARSALGAAARAAGPLLFSRPDLQLCEEPLLPLFSLRASRAFGRDSAADFVSSHGLQLPLQPGIATGDESCSIAWIEPRAWWILGDNAGAVLQGALPPKGLYLTELTARFCMLRISGSMATAVLASAVSLDLSEASFANGCYARTKFAEFGGAYLQRFGQGYRIAMDVGLGHCLADWLHDAVTHFASPESPISQQLRQQSSG